MFIAVGAACSDLKDSQGMMTPVMMLLMVPMFLWYPVLRAPDGTMSTLLSLFPTAAPFLMMLRISLAPGPPLWQIAIAAVLMAATTVVTIWAAAKIFRTGLLMQGKTARLARDGSLGSCRLGPVAPGRRAPLRTIRSFTHPARSTPCFN